MPKPQEDNNLPAPTDKNRLMLEKMKKIEEKAKAEADNGRHYRIYASAGNPLDTATYRFVAEFARRKPAEKYARYIHNKKRYSDKTILIKEVTARQPDADEGEIVYAMSPLGEFLPRSRILPRSSLFRSRPNTRHTKRKNRRKEKKSHKKTATQATDSSVLCVAVILIFTPGGLWI